MWRVLLLVQVLPADGLRAASQTFSSASGFKVCQMEFRDTATDVVGMIEQGLFTRWAVGYFYSPS